MRKLVLDRDADMGTTEYFYSDGEGGGVIETVQDVTDIIEHNKYVANEDTGRFGDLNRVASYPLVIYHELKSKGILDDDKAYRRWLNDPDNRVFRCKLGKV